MVKKIVNNYNQNYYNINNKDKDKKINHNTTQVISNTLFQK